MKNSLRKFIFLTSIIVSIFLFSFGVIVVGFLQERSGADSNTSIIQNIPILEDFQKTTKPVNILFTVFDEEGLRTDTIVLINYNPVNAKMNMLSIPRDTKVYLNNSISKINAAYVYGGAQLTVNTVSNLLGLNIQYYVSVNISVVRDVVDLLGGVDFNVPIDMKYDDRSQNLHINLKKGMQHLDGNKSEQLLRFRKPNNGYFTKEMLKFYDGSDIKRTETQLKFLKALLAQKANPSYISMLGDILDVVFSKLKTNMTISDITNLAHNSSELSLDSLKSFSIQGYCRTEYGASYFIYNNSIKDFESGKILDSKNIIDTYFMPGKSSHFNAAIDPSYRQKLDYNNANYHEPKPTLKPSPKPTPKPNKPTPTKNPSNTDTSVTGDPTPKP